MKSHRLRLATLRHRITSKKSLLLATTTFITTFVIYLRTLLPSVGYSGDTAKFQFIGKILGIPHPPGYPLYIMLTYFFGKLPIGNLAYRINLMSAIFASLTVALLSITVLRITGNSIVAFLTALIFGFSRTFWSQAVIAEVYTLNACFLAAVILLLILWGQDRRPVYFYFACFSYAISFGNHLLMITMLPAFALFIMLTDYKILLSKKTILLIFACILAGMFQYTYVFVKLDSSFSEMYTQSLSFNLSTFIGRMKGFLSFVTGGEFRAEMFAFSLQEIIRERIPLFFYLLRENMLIEGIIAGCAGLCFMLKQNSKMAIFLLLIILGNLTYALNYDIEDIFVYFIPTYLVFVMFIGYCNEGFKDRKADPFINKLHCWNFLCIAVSGILCWKMITTNYAFVDQSQNTYEDFFTTTVLEKIEERSVIMPPRDDNYTWTLFYLYKLLGEEKRPNNPIPLPGYFFNRGNFPFSQWDILELENYLKQRVHVYVQDNGDRDTLKKQGYMLQKTVFYQGEHLKNFLKNLKKNHLLLVSIKYEATAALDHSIMKTMATFGLHQNLIDKLYNSYAAIGVAQSGEHHFSGLERIGMESVSIALKRGEKIGTSDLLFPVDIEITSNGARLQTEVNKIRINRKNYSPNRQGMNIVVLDSKSGKVLRTTSFNTHMSLYRDEVGLWKVVGKTQNDKVLMFSQSDEAAKNFWALEEDLIDLTNKNHRKHLLKGWLQTKMWGTTASTPSEVIWYQEKQSQKFLSIIFVTRSFIGATNGKLHVYLNGKVVNVLSLPLKNLERIILPADMIKNGFNLLRLGNQQDDFFMGIKKIILR